MVGEPESSRWGEPGFDCSSFVSTVYRHFGEHLTGFTDAAYDELVPAADPRPGDAVFFRYADRSQPGVVYPHMGLWVDGAQTLDCRYGYGVGYHRMLRTAYEVRRPRGW